MSRCFLFRKPGAETEAGLVIVPSYYEMDDFHLFADYAGIAAYDARMLSPQSGYESWITAFDGYYKFGLCYMTMFHPQIIGKPGYVMLLDRLLTYMRKFPRVWYARGDREILDRKAVLMPTRSALGKDEFAALMMNHDAVCLGRTFGASHRPVAGGDTRCAFNGEKSSLDTREGRLRR